MTNKLTVTELQLSKIYEVVYESGKTDHISLDARLEDYDLLKELKRRGVTKYKEFCDKGFTTIGEKSYTIEYDYIETERHGRCAQRMIMRVATESEAKRIIADELSEYNDAQIIECIELTY